MNDLALPLVPVSVGRFRVETTLLRCSGHALYQAIDTRSGAPVTLKCGLPGVDHRLLEPGLKGEWEATRRFTHPRIQKALEMGHEAGIGTFLVFPALEGRGLSTLTSDGIPPYSALELLLQLKQALEAAAKDGCHHGDLRPENLWIDPEGNLLVLGFGSGVWAGPDGHAVPTQAWAYLTPERLRGAPPSPASEVFAFAVTAFEVLTGHLPYEPSSPGGSNVYGLGRRLHLPPDMPEAMRQVFSHAMDWRPENHYANLHSFLSVLIAASPLEEDRLEALLANLDGPPIPREVPSFFGTAPAASKTSYSPRDTQPMALQLPMNGQGHPIPASRPPVQAEAAKPATGVRHLATLALIEAFLGDFPGVQEFAIYSDGDTPVASSNPCRTLSTLAPSAYFPTADALHASEGVSPVLTITIKSQRLGSIILLRQAPFSIALLLKTGKSSKGLLEGLGALRST